MRTIIGKSEIWSYFDDGVGLQKATNSTIRNSLGYQVSNYLDLAKKVATLQYKNPEHVLLFRGQCSDHKNQKKYTTLKPSLFRPSKGTIRIPGQTRLIDRFEFLTRAERELVERYSMNPDFLGNIPLRRYRILRWSILQHYEICFTPLLDVTHSLRVAASFASEKDDEAFVYVLGVPNISGSVTASAESGLQIIRLSSVCPPVAVRPHIQEGYLLGEYPDMPDFSQKQHYEAYEIDFGRRLIAKFRFSPKTFWADKNFPKIAKEALYPDIHDPLFDLATQLKRDLGPQE